ncbi:MAG: hypothetical protein PHO52_13410 [Sulfuricurvum sp.]|uniref:hypothetical protein n=1 Tax=Sulfuricurvum sp. TaxID=2025608 RepID=UPI0026202521|nr:hypothetical protein [Sulfuricurvum sp.]MDD2785201.1 hypothetical protein [Sulfuricurvum sp.]
MQNDEVVEIVYYRLLEMEQRITQKAQALAVLVEKAEEICKRFEALQNEMKRKSN